ncbi:MAG: tandem-95 repeat protein [Acidobacteria bacterium]|nr:tandem-95 repeat protein [Acidobacteriota bacterium]
MNLPTSPLGAHLSPFARLFAACVFAVCLCALAPAARGVEIQVEGLQDSLLGPPQDFNINHCTLRKAVNNANDDSAPYPQCQAGSGADTIVFNLPGTVTFALAGANEEGGETGDLDVTDDLTITGHPDGTTIDAADLDRVFHVHAGVTLTLVNIHLTNGRYPNGGGVLVEQGATLNLINSTISSSFAFQGPGGGIYASSNSVVNVTNSTLSGNSAEDHGGAMFVEGGAVVNITNSTITGNFSNTGLCGGIANGGGTVNLRSSIVAGNTNQSVINQIPNLNGVFQSQGYNVIGDLGSAAPADPAFNAQATDQVGVANAQVNLGPLQSNGGPVPTHALQTGSVAIDKGHSSGSVADQRGLTRPCDLASVANAAGGDGGDAGAFEVQGVCVVPQQPPAANDDNANVVEDSGANPIPVLANDTDANGDTLTVFSVTQGAHGSVSNNGSSVSYTPNANYNGPDSFTYTVSDGHGNFDSATVTVNVQAVNDAPVANNDNYNMNQDTTLSVLPASGVLANDTDIDNPVQTAVLDSGPAHAAAFGFNADGSFSYTPHAGFTGVDTFDYHVYDGTDNSNVATVTINVKDTQAPSVGCGVRKALLWPPNSDLVGVGLSVTATDNDGEDPALVIDVFSDEDDAAQPGGMSPDAKDVAAGTLRLRAERRGDADGRVYVIRIKATDQSNNTSYSYCTVVVPHSQGKADLNAVNAQAAAAVAAFVANGNNPPAGFFLVGDGPAVGPKQ